MLVDTLVHSSHRGCYLSTIHLCCTVENNIITAVKHTYMEVEEVVPELECGGELEELDGVILIIITANVLQTNTYMGPCLQWTCHHS